VFAEAMAAALPIVTTRSGGAVDAIKEGITGFIVSPTVDAFKKRLLQLIDDKDLRTQLSKQARERAQLFSTNAMAKKLISIYNAAIKRSGKDIPGACLASLTSS